ncbi:hypothetical protein EDB86DRAFT_3001194 [Lactarius hatsudake]|nr:hypothetical protein EDB86DRAFT_3001194 [Lactarius hatsudake]
MRRLRSLLCQAGGFRYSGGTSAVLAFYHVHGVVVCDSGHLLRVNAGVSVFMMSGLMWSCFNKKTVQ